MARPTARRPAFALAATAALMLAAVLVAGPAAAAIGAAYPVQSLGDRGTDVAAIQQLFRYHQRTVSSGGGAAARGISTGALNPLTVTIDGVFGASTDAAIRAFQSSRGLAANGVVDGATWQALVVPLGPGSTGDAVAALQRELRAKRGATAVPIDGVYGTSTTAAVSAFQAHMGLVQTGSVDAATWRSLVWHFEQPRFSASALCDYDVISHNWGTAEMVATLGAAGRVVVGAGYGQIAVGDMSLEHGGDTPLHKAHEVGLDADLRPMKKANDQCSSGTRWTLSTYDRTATRALVDAIRASTPNHVKWIFFNDPVLIREGRTTYLAGHDDHLHVHLCEADQPDPDYRC